MYDIIKRYVENENEIKISGSDFCYVINKATGNLEQIEVGGKSLLKEDINQLFKVTLTPDEEKIMRMRYGLEPYTYVHSLDEAAEKLKIPREQVRQIEAKATRKLKHPSKSKKLRSYILDEQN